MAWTSPEPNAWYICLAVWMFCPALSVVMVAVLAVMDGSYAESLGDCLPGTVSNGHRPELSTVQSILDAGASFVGSSRPDRFGEVEDDLW